MRARGYGVVGAAVATAAVVGVGTWIGVAGSQSKPAPPKPQLTVLLQQYRVDESLHQVRLIVTNDEPEPVLVESAQLVSPDFDLVDPERHDTELAPGGKVQVALQTTFGAGRCAGEIRTTARPASARLWVRSSDGEVNDFVFPLDDRYKYLDTLLRRDCEQQKINTAADVSFSDRWEAVTTAAGKQAVRTGIRLKLLDPNATVDVVELKGSILFNLNPLEATDPIGHIDASNPQVEIPVDFTNNRCEPHARGEGGGHTFVFQFWFSVDGSDPISRTFSPDDAGIEALRELVDRGCDVDG